MIRTPEIVLLRVAGAVGGHTVDNTAVAPPETIAATGFASRRVVADGEDLFTLACAAARRLLPAGDPALGTVGAIVAASFSHEMRFPPLAVRVAGALGLAPSTPAFDLQAACSAYPGAVYLAGRLAADTGRRVLLVHGDVQSRLSDPSDAATTPLFSDAATATLLEASPAGESSFDFLTRPSLALSCPAEGPIGMDGFKVFAFVAKEVVSFLRPFGTDVDWFVPHQANLYMVRQLAKALKLEERLLTCGADLANPGGASVPLALARRGRAGRALIAGFGAGLTASAAVVRLAPGVAAGLADASGRADVV